MKNSVIMTVGALVGAALISLASIGSTSAEEDKQIVDIGPFELEDGGKAGKKDAVLEEGRWVSEDSGVPTYYVAPDGTVDFMTYRGFQRYHAECHVCHGPEGLGSTYAPALVESVKTMTYEDFVGVVASGQVRKAGGTEYVMPALGDNKNVMCYLDAMYVYLKARSADAVPRGRPRNRASKPKEVGEFENACLAG